MGIIQQFHCSSCHQSWALNVGHGMMHGILGQVMKAFPEDIQMSIIKDIPRKERLLFDFQYQTALCRHCQDIVAVPVLCFLESGKIYIAGCPECGGKAECFEEDSLVMCPRCGYAFLDMHIEGCWD